MARLQDFPSVTPTSSDNILIIQPQGQGLAPHTIKLDSTNPTGTGSLSMNRKANTTVGAYSTTEGNNGTASDNFAHAEGSSTSATNQAAHSEGSGTTAGGLASHAEGEATTASGRDAHSEGNGTTASGNRSHAEGSGTIANRRAQHVFGEYNVADTDGADETVRGNYVEIVGKGSGTNSRSNARTLDWSGNEVLAGRLTINGDRPVSTILSFNKSSSSQSINDKALWDEVFGEIPNEYYGLIKIYFKSSYSVTAMANKASANWGSILAIANGDYNPYFYTYANGTTTLHKLAYV